MIRVAFFLNFTKDYKGGINYLKNLLFAYKTSDLGGLSFFLFVPDDIEQEYIDLFSPYAEIVKTGLLRKGTLPWFIDKVFQKVFVYNILLVNLMKKYKISVVSHSNFFSNSKQVKSVNWIPDFQVLHYPDLWSEKERENSFKLYDRIIKHSDRIILSSNDAYKDYKTLTTPDNWDKVSVLQFVSQPAKMDEEKYEEVVNAVKSKYKIDRPFFYLPNQFWSHKNHITVFKAIKILKDQGLNPLLVTTGHMVDYRANNNHVQMIKDYINDNDLSAHILLLGLIPYDEVLVLIRSCLKLINPSLFEGWSSTVEEAKSTGKGIILSDIPIHREQNPADGIYFNSLDEQELALIIEKILNSTEKDTALKIEQAKNNLLTRTEAFARNYKSIIDKVIAVNKS